LDWLTDKKHGRLRYAHSLEVEKDENMLFSVRKKNKSSQGETFPVTFITQNTEHQTQLKQHAEYDFLNI